MALETNSRAFIDSAYLHSKFEEYMNATYGFVQAQMDYPALKRELECDEATFYDACVVPQPTPREKWHEHWSITLKETDELKDMKSNFLMREKCKAIEAVPGFKICLGSVQHTKQKEPYRLKQKGVDVFLALDAFEYGLKPDKPVVMLMAGDLDFMPLMYKLRQSQVPVTLWCPRRSSSRELKAAAETWIEMDPSFFSRIDGMRGVWGPPVLRIEGLQHTQYESRKVIGKVDDRSVYEFKVNESTAYTSWGADLSSTTKADTAVVQVDEKVLLCEDRNTLLKSLRHCYYLKAQ